jgi:hypothetical protein
MSDYKYDIQLLAETIAEEELGKDYWALPDEMQTTVFKLAEERYWERRYSV